MNGIERRPEGRHAGNARPLEILLAEDDAEQAALAREALATAFVAARLSVARDGDEVLEMLDRAPPHAESRRPDVILLDLDLPKRDGREVLRALKRDPRHRAIPVVMLTTSASEWDVAAAYELGASCYVTKPVDAAEYVRVVRAVEAFWSRVATPPPRALGG